jgi:molybdopterin converting factor small subunit
MLAGALCRACGSHRTVTDLAVPVAPHPTNALPPVGSTEHRYDRQGSHRAIAFRVDEGDGMPHVVFPRSWADATGGVHRVEVPADDLGSLIAALRARFPGLDGWLENGAGGLPDYTNVFVDDVDVRVLGGVEAALADDDEVSFIVEMSGG